MSVTATNLIQGPATLYTGAFGATEPADSAINSTPAASAWTDVGGTMNGVVLTVTQTYTELDVDQVVDVVGRRLTKRESTIKTSLAEVTAINIGLALNNLGTVTTGSGVTPTVYDPGNGSTLATPNYVAVLFDGQAPAGFKRRVVVRKMLQTDALAQNNEKDKQGLLPVTFAGHWVSAAISPYRLSDGNQ